MNIITADTKISALIKANPEAIDVIAGINAHFKKLQNPLLRKLFASRVTIGEAARIGKCEIDVFFERLQPLGFVVTKEEKIVEKEPMIPERKAFHSELDVRNDIASGNDPFKKIMEAVSLLKPGETLLLVNSFEPIPLVRILQKRNYSVAMVPVERDKVFTYITSEEKGSGTFSEEHSGDGSYSEIERRFEGSLTMIDVRSLPMPQPMMMILKQLGCLDTDHALFVYHKKLPLFLLPELKEQGFAFVHRQVTDGVQLIIYKEGNSAHDAS